MARIGNPHAHVEFFWSKAAALAYNHALAVIRTSSGAATSTKTPRS